MASDFRSLLVFLQNDGLNCMNAKSQDEGFNQMTTPTDNQDECRKAFEKWADTAGYDTEAVDLCDRVDGRFYQSLDAQVQWTAWQAAWNRSKPPADGEVVQRIKEMAVAHDMSHEPFCDSSAWKDDFQNHYEAALAALSSGSAPVEKIDWQPIETAPRDVDFDVCGIFTWNTGGKAYSKNIRVCNWHITSNTPYPFIPNKYYEHGGETGIFTLTYWMIAPTPPSVETDHPQPNGSATGEGVGVV